MIYSPPDSNGGGNLGTALALWNKFQQPGAPSPSNPVPGNEYTGAIGPTPSGAPLSGPPGPTPSGAPLAAANVVPGTPSWDPSNPWFGSPQPTRQGSVQQPDQSQSNLSKAAPGLLGSLGSFLGGI